jgi:hypothetical protein
MIVLSSKKGGKMNRNLAYAGLLLLTFLAGCAAMRPDYDTTRQHSEDAHRALNNESVK